MMTTCCTALAATHGIGGGISSVRYGWVPLFCCRPPFRPCCATCLLTANVPLGCLSTDGDFSVSPTAARERHASQPRCNLKPSAALYAVCYITVSRIGHARQIVTS